jgi:tripartite-type tricarboxylate transporter receptor subunit TctC
VSALPQIQAGRVKALAVMGEKRSPALPDVPTPGEAGLPGVEASAWYGIMAPAGTPRPIVDRVHRIILGAMDTADLKQQFAAQGLEPVGMGPDEFQAFMKVDLQRWRQVIASTGIKGQ